MLAELIDDCDAVFHLAASVGVRLIVESPVRTIETNVKGTEGVLEFANKKRKKVLIASTSEVYGKSAKIPFSEDDDLVMGSDLEGQMELRLLQGDRRISGAGLLEGEKSAGGHRAAFQHRRAAPDGPLRHGAAEFCAGGARAATAAVFGDGKQSRCFCHVSDTVGALARLIEHPDAVGQIFNIGERRRNQYRRSRPSGEIHDRQHFTDPRHSL